MPLIRLPTSRRTRRRRMIATSPPPGGLSPLHQMSRQQVRAKRIARLAAREQQAGFLARAGQLMIKTSKVATAELDLDGTLSALAGLALPYQGVWCILDVLESDRVRR